MKKIVLILAALLLLSSPAWAQYRNPWNQQSPQPYERALQGQRQGYSVHTPGQLPSQVYPSPGGGYSVHTPGRLPSQIYPAPGGGYSIHTPGQLPTQVYPR